MAADSSGGQRRGDTASVQEPVRQPRTVHLVSLGCPKNTVDSEQMLGLLRGNGYQLTADPQAADVVVINTCGFIQAAKEESIEAIMAAHQLRRTGRCRAVVVTGCLATRYEHELRQELVEADQIVTIEQERDIVPYVDQALHAAPREPVISPPVSLTPSHWAYLRISDGCDHRCSFCTIPAIRGRHCSQSIDSLTARTRQLAEGGVRELVLVSQDSMRYGRDLYGRPALVSLLRQLLSVDGIEWIRLMYAYPAYWTDDLIQLFAASPRLCSYIDMPLQHISDPVLRRMKRAASRKQTVRLLERLRERLPGVGLRTTFIVGFPGETESQFQELLDFVAETRFDHVAGFVYSPEEGTAAYELEGRLDPEVGEERYARLSELQEGISAEINTGLIGTVHRVLVDARDPEEGVCYARMERDAPEIDGQVVIDSVQSEPGSFVQVEITDGYAYERRARIVSADSRT